MISTLSKFNILLFRNARLLNETTLFVYFIGTWILEKISWVYLGSITKRIKSSKNSQITEDFWKLDELYIDWLELLGVILFSSIARANNFLLVTFERRHCNIASRRLSAPHLKESVFANWETVTFCILINVVHADKTRPVFLLKTFLSNYREQFTYTEYVYKAATPFPWATLYSFREIAKRFLWIVLQILSTSHNCNVWILYSFNLLLRSTSTVLFLLPDWTILAIFNHMPGCILAAPSSKDSFILKCKTFW